MRAQLFLFSRMLVAGSDGFFGVGVLFCGFLGKRVKKFKKESPQFCTWFTL
ncbi:MAG: hypothetical protein Ct9H90mP27_5730 [Gammaproteobacteria bacterium]|nr:MAG: hypothetical protein Ct9H90mP27_5730 [Gammaproteobacteria bacterium]